MDVSDSGAAIIDHFLNVAELYRLCGGQSFGGLGSGGSVEECQPVAERFRRNNTWVVPTWTAFAITLIPQVGSELGAGSPGFQRLYQRMRDRSEAFWTDSTSPADSIPIRPDSAGLMSIMERVDFPILAGTDAGMKHGGVTPTAREMLPGLALHTEVAMYVAEGMTPLAALRTATLNPAKFLHATDSLGTVAPGKLADLVLLGADPLADITNTTAIRAVVANGRYFDRAALDGLLAEVRAKAEQNP